ncbi:hypothetical protein RRG08_028145 [Elysia crispata]|uniref:Uncharacterized protein n=1 Tax=Elysia crispata TaxID=231223 RepID=A0AAE0YXZ6_9GAST|nr:hypothetical protein RRG08_028145 [Elysia crispata]
MLIYEARLIIETVSAVSLSQHCVRSGNVMCSKPTLTGRFDVRLLGKPRYLHMVIYEASKVNWKMELVAESAVSLSQHCVSSGNVMCSKPTLTGRFDLRLLWETSISTELSIKQGQLKTEFSTGQAAAWLGFEPEHSTNRAWYPTAAVNRAGTTCDEQDISVNLSHKLYREPNGYLAACPVEYRYSSHTN